METTHLSEENQDQMCALYDSDSADIGMQFNAPHNASKVGCIQQAITFTYLVAYIFHFIIHSYLLANAFLSSRKLDNIIYTHNHRILATIEIL